jgi:hypothetical protein
MFKAYIYIYITLLEIPKQNMGESILISHCLLIYFVLPVMVVKWRGEGEESFEAASLQVVESSASQRYEI